MYNLDMNPKALLSSNASLMYGRQRISSILELGDDKIIRLYKKKDNTILFTAPADKLMYSRGSTIKSRLRLSTLIEGQESGVRIGVKSSDSWIATLKKYGAQAHPQEPEAKLDHIGIWVALGLLALMGIVIILIRAYS